MLTSLVSLLPSSAQPYAKGITAALVSTLTVLASTLPSVPEWLPVVLAVLTAPAVYLVPNLEAYQAKHEE